MVYSKYSLNSNSYNYNNPQAQAYNKQLSDPTTSLPPANLDANEANYSDQNDDYNNTVQDDENGSDPFANGEIENADLDLGGEPIDSFENDELLTDEEGQMPMLSPEEMKKKLTKDKKDLSSDLKDFKNEIASAEIDAKNLNLFLDQMKDIEKQIKKSDDLDTLSLAQNDWALLQTQVDAYKNGTGKELTSFEEKVNTYLQYDFPKKGLTKDLFDKFNTDLSKLVTEANLDPSKLGDLKLKFEDIQKQIDESPLAPAKLKENTKAMEVVENVAGFLAKGDSAKKTEIIKEIYADETILNDILYPSNHPSDNMLKFIMNRSDELKALSQNPKIRIKDSKDEDCIMARKTFRDKLAEVFKLLGFKVEVPEHGTTAGINEQIPDPNYVKKNKWDSNEKVPLIDTHGDKDFNLSDDISIEFDGQMLRYDILFDSTGKIKFKMVAEDGFSEI